MYICIYISPSKTTQSSTSTPKVKIYLVISAPLQSSCPNSNCGDFTTQNSQKSRHESTTNGFRGGFNPWKLLRSPGGSLVGHIRFWPRLIFEQYHTVPNYWGYTPTNSWMWSSKSPKRDSVMTPCGTEKVDFSKKKTHQKQNHLANNLTGRITRDQEKIEQLHFLSFSSSSFLFFAEAFAFCFLCAAGPIRTVTNFIHFCIKFWKAQVPLPRKIRYLW